MQKDNGIDPNRLIQIRPSQLESYLGDFGCVILTLLALQDGAAPWASVCRRVIMLTRPTSGWPPLSSVGVLRSHGLVSSPRVILDGTEACILDVTWYGQVKRFSCADRFAESDGRLHASVLQLVGRLWKNLPDFIIVECVVFSRRDRTNWWGSPDQGRPKGCEPGRSCTNQYHIFCGLTGL